MKSHTPRRLFAAIAFLSTDLAWAGTVPATPYAGQQSRTIKSLSDSDVAGLLAGNGAALAKAAELNGYPGPAHVLELAQELHLSEDQAKATRALMDQHKREASRSGAALIEAERHLDSLFAQGEATTDNIDKATARVGELRARLRAEHLKTHLAQTALLKPHQVRRYASLRGYDSAPGTAAPAKHAPAIHAH